MGILSHTRKRGSMMILFSVILFPVLVILFLLVIFPLICGTCDMYLNYYTITAVSLINVIPFLCGAVMFAKGKDNLSASPGSGKTRNQNYASFIPLKQSVLCGFISFMIIFPVILLTDAVSTEGWLRSIYAAMLLGLSAPFIYLLFYLLNVHSERCFYLLLISLLLIVTVPLGMIFHHPWNYFLFFSPFYWISWAWIIGSPFESLMYGLIAMALLLSAMIISLRSLRKSL
jgi:hypothetical protein